MTNKKALPSQQGIRQFEKRHQRKRKGAHQKKIGYSELPVDTEICYGQTPAINDKITSSTRKEPLKCQKIIRPAVQDFESITIPIANVRNDLIQLLLQLRESAAKREEEI